MLTLTIPLAAPAAATPSPDAARGKRDAGPPRERAGAEGSRRGRELAARLVKGTGPGAIAARAALRWIGTPYSWGGGNASGPTRGIARGRNTVGFDCSGLVTYAWAKAGVELGHYATTQYRAGPHPRRDELRAGDLVFFAHNPARPATIHHVGIYIGRGDMVEAPFTGARVRISRAFRRDYAGATRPAPAGADENRVRSSHGPRWVRSGDRRHRRTARRAPHPA